MKTIFKIFISGNESSSPNKFSRSLSIDSPKHFSSPQEKTTLYPSFFLDDGGGREMPIDVNPEGENLLLA